jgi:hypothetical protein
MIPQTTSGIPFPIYQQRMRKKKFDGLFCIFEIFFHKAPYSSINPPSPSRKSKFKAITGSAENTHFRLKQS